MPECCRRKKLSAFFSTPRNTAYIYSCNQLILMKWSFSWRGISVFAFSSKPRPWCGRWMRFNRRAIWLVDQNPIEMRRKKENYSKFRRSDRESHFVSTRHRFLFSVCRSVDGKLNWANDVHRTNADTSRDSIKFAVLFWWVPVNGWWINYSLVISQGLSLHSTHRVRSFVNMARHWQTH